MRGVQVLFAFIVSLVLMSGVYYGVWYYSMKQIVNDLPDILEETMPHKVKFNKIDTVFHPFKSKLELQNTTISMLDSKTGGSVVVELGTLTLLTKPFDFRKIEVVLPEDFRMVTTYQGRSHEYRTTLIDPVLEWNENGEGYDIAFSMSGLLVKGRQNGFFANLIKLGYSYVSYDVGLGQWSLVANNLDVNRIKPFYRWPLVSSVSVNFTPKGTSAFPLGYLLSAAGSQDKVAFDTMVMNYLKNFAMFNQVDVIDSRIVVDGTWYSYKGSMFVDDELYLQVNGSLSSNKFAVMMDGIKDIMGGFPLALERMLKRIGLGENKVQSVTLMSNGSILNVNGAPVGVMPTLPEQLNLHGRGAR